MINLETADGFRNLIQCAFCILGLCNYIACAGAYAYVVDDEILVSNRTVGRLMQAGCIFVTIAWWIFYVVIIAIDLMCCFRVHILITSFLIAYAFSLLTFDFEYLHTLAEDANMFAATNIGPVKLAIGMISATGLVILAISTDFGMLEMIGNW